MGVSTLDQASAKTLAQAWFFPTGDAVTAEPIVVGGVVYVGSWDGTFYAIDAAHGTLVWKHALDLQPAVKPVPGHRQPGDATSDGGIVTSTAVYQPGAGGGPDLVIFGGGFTLYALRAADGGLFWKHVYSGHPESPPDPQHDPTRILASPAVVGNAVLFSVSADGATRYRGYLAAADLGSGDPLWVRELDGRDASGKPLDDGCGNVWASPAVEAAAGIEVVGVADCSLRGTTSPHAEHVLGVRITDGSIAWEFAPPRLPPHAGGRDPACDFDFGATANIGANSGGRPAFVGVGGKDGTYYSLNPLHPAGPPLWATRVVFGGGSGGFIGSTAYDGSRVFGATAIGDFSPPGLPCEPANPTDTAVQEPSLHAFDGGSGAVVWQQAAAQSLGPTTESNGLVFTGTVLSRRIQVSDGATGAPVAVLPAMNSDSGVVVAGNAIFFGTGSSEQGTGDGVHAFTPLGVAPSAPLRADVAELPVAGGLLGTILLVGSGLAYRHAWRSRSRLPKREPID